MKYNYKKIFMLKNYEKLIFFKNWKFVLGLIISLCTHILLFIGLDFKNDNLLGDKFIPIQLIDVDTSFNIGDSLDETTLFQKISLSIMQAKEIIEKNKRGHMTNPPAINRLINTNLLSNL